MLLVLGDSWLRDTCYNCLHSGALNTVHASDKYQRNNNALLNNCDRCKLVKYCSKECQTSTWNSGHKHECKIFKENSMVPSAIRATMRILNAFDHGLATDQEQEQFLALDAHQADIANSGGRWANFAEMVDAIKRVSKSNRSTEFIYKVVSIIATTSLPLHDANLSRMGEVFHPLTARINHSCEPNCIVRNDVSRAYTPTSTPAPLFGSFSIHSIRPIATGEEITIEYSDSADSVDLRQSFFQDSFFFKCSCARCSPSLPHGVQEGDNNAAMSFAATMSQVVGDPDPRLGYESPILSYRAA